MGGSSPRDVTRVAHVFTAHVRADPGLVWTALTDPIPGHRERACDDWL